MKILFGLPGTGKSVKAKECGTPLSLDLGPDQLSVKQLEKLAQFTAQLLPLLRDDVIVDAYPHYFDPKLLDGMNLDITFAIPEGEEELILNRIAERDGEDSEFYKLYSKKIKSWIGDWLELLREWDEAGIKYTVVPYYELKSAKEVK